MRKFAVVVTCLWAMFGNTLAGGGGDGSDRGDGSDGDGDGSDGGDRCDSAWAKLAGDSTDALCFRDAPLLKTKKWGWNNKIANEDGTTDLELWAGAGKCKTQKGWRAGTVKVVVANGEATVTYEVDAGVSIEEFHLYVGKAKWVLNGKKNP
eukprot:Hpha_TRINITY_DN16647_c1_g5::TRINITY_DN16647_c1_g5_i1::g.181413::m.181413